MSLAIVGASAVRPTAVPGQVERVENATLLVEDGRISWLRRAGEVPAGATTIDARGRLLTPGLVDCHTHAWFLGDRAREFGERVAGASYLEIARRGGGIQSTVRATREGSSQERREALERRLRALAGQGVTTVEVKSGYGLSAAAELAALEDIAAVAGPGLPSVTPTLLAAHAIPPEVTTAAARAAWVQTIATELIPEASRRKLAERVDVFVEAGAYSAAEAKQICVAARQHGLAIHLHVDQLTDGGGAAFAARMGAEAVAHVEKITDDGIAALAKAGVVAVLIPTATTAAGVEGFAPARKLIVAGVTIALSTNLNPGTAPTESTSLLFFLAAVGLKLSPEEILWAATRGGARALGRSDIGCLEPGAAADFTIWNARELAHLPYHAGVNHVRQVYREGRLIADRSPAADAECSGTL